MPSLVLTVINEHVRQTCTIPATEEDLEEDVIPEEFKKKINKLSKREFNTAEMVIRKSG